MTIPRWVRDPDTIAVMQIGELDSDERALLRRLDRASEQDRPGIEAELEQVRAFRGEWMARLNR